MPQEPYPIAHEKAVPKEKDAQTRCLVFQSLQELQENKNDSEKLKITE
jgi:hypothetical protein